MNHVYRLVWNRALCVLQAVAETGRAQTASPGQGGAVLPVRPRLRTFAAALLAGLAGTLAATAWAAPAAGTLPSGATYSLGLATITWGATTMDVVQTSTRLPIDWTSFSLGSSATATFAQPVGGIALLRDNSLQASQIDGVLSANQSLLHTNAAGTVFGANAMVNVGQLLSTSLALQGSDADFLTASEVTLAAGASRASVVNAGGTLSASGGSVALVGGSVSNSGTILASQGRITLLAADEVRLNLADGSVAPTANGALAAALGGGAAVSNTGALMADKGTIVLQAKAVPNLFTTLVNNYGSLTAASGSVQLIAEGGAVVNTGTISVSRASASDPGGQVLLSSDAAVHLGGSVSAAGGQIVAQGASLDLSGDLTADRVALNAQATVSQASGSVQATSLSLSALGNVLLTSATNAIAALDASTVGGNLALTSASSLSQSGALAVSGTSTFATMGSLSLTNADNSFGGAVNVTANGVALRAAGDLRVASLDNRLGPISLVADGALTLPPAALDSGTGALQLESRGGTLAVNHALNGGSVSLVGRDGITLAAAVTASSQLSLGAHAGQTILVTGALQAPTTVINSGIVQVGTGGTAGSIAGNITNNAALVYNRSDNVTIAGTIGGTGSLQQQGTGRLELQGANAYTGATIVSAGTLALSGMGSVATSSGVQVAAPAVFDVSGLNASEVDVRGISGAGTLLLGSKTLTVGAGHVSTTFAGVMSGAGATLRKAGSGTLTLLGANTYGGGTELKEGRIDVGHGDALGSGALAMDDGTTLGFAANGLTIANAIRLTGTQDPVIDTGSFNATLSGAITGTGFLTKEGSGTLTLTGANNYSGATQVAAGTLAAGTGNTFSAGSAVTVASGATLDLAGHSQRIAGLGNAGTVSLAGATPGTTLAVTGPWVGSGGVLRLGTALGDNGSATDKVLLSGPSAVASGSTFVRVTNLGGLGARTTGNGIEIVGTENGGSIQPGAFSLAGTLSAGAYDYHLVTTGSAVSLSSNIDAPTLASPTPQTVVVPTYRAEAPLLAAVPEQLREAGLAMVGNLHQRTGDEATPGMAAGPRTGWGRVIGIDRGIRQEGTLGAASSGRQSGAQVGTDLWGHRQWRVGVYAGQIEGDMDVTGFARGVQHYAAGANDVRSQFLGGYATWRGEDGLYVDSVLQAGRLRYTAHPALAASASGKGSSVLASVELGQALKLAPGWTVEPQLQLASQHLRLDDLTLAGATVQQDNASTWLARIGVRVKGEIAVGTGRLQPYARANVYRRGSGSDTARFIGPAATTDIESRTGGTSTELALGATWQISPRVAAYGEVGHLWASGGDARTQGSASGSVGLKLSW
ncbi:MAG: autotransporter outer membrane beta-barrel domain-containing protein [Variovorax sp.]|nr:autotransporter outer membrane beta-barrel domain-containing protein [Variovorax sp.]